MKKTVNYRENLYLIDFPCRDLQFHAENHRNCNGSFCCIFVIIACIESLRVFNCHCDSCGNIIYNSLPTDLLKEEAAIRHLDPGSVRMDFTTETGREMEQVFAEYRGLFLKDTGAGQSYELPQTTRGHFRRGVE